MNDPTPTVRSLIEDATRSLDAALALASVPTAPPPEPEPDRAVPWAFLLELVEAVEFATASDVRRLADAVTDLGIQVQGWRAVAVTAAGDRMPTPDEIADIVEGAIEAPVASYERDAIKSIVVGWFGAPQE